MCIIAVLNVSMLDSMRFGLMLDGLCVGFGIVRSGSTYGTMR